MAETGVATTNVIGLATALVTGAPTGGATTCDLWRTLMLRAGENPDTSTWGPAALHYLNRAYMAVVRGGAEFEPASHTDWHWLRKQPPGVLVLDPEIATSVSGITAQVVHNSQTVNLSQAPGSPLTGWYLQVTQPRSDICRVLSHNAGSSTLLLDVPFPGATGTNVPLWLRHFEYRLPSDLLHLIEPLHTSRLQGGHAGQGVIRLTSALGVSDTWPLDAQAVGMPDACALVGGEPSDPGGIPLLRFNRSANAQTGPIRIEYQYTFLPPMLTQMSGTCDEVPLLPIRARWTLVDLALGMFLLDKGDNRADASFALGKNGIIGLAREQRHEQGVSGRGIGRIRPRQTGPTVTGVRYAR